MYSQALRSAPLAMIMYEMKRAPLKKKVKLLRLQDFPMAKTAFFGIFLQCGHAWFSE